VARTAADISLDIDELKSRISATAEELDERLNRLPRFVQWGWKHRRIIVIIKTIVFAGLLARGAQRASESSHGQRRGSCCCCECRR
jgi:hypothetical protein